MITVYWDERYSSSMEDDKFGRWARVAFCGNRTESFADKISWFQIAWIKKHIDHVTNQWEGKFTIKYYIPYDQGHIFNDLESAKLAVEKSINWFVKMIL